MGTWYGLAEGHCHPTVAAFWACRACRQAHRQTCGGCGW
jgi:hypothetical protein